MSKHGGDELYHDPDLAQFYDLANGWRPSFDYCLTLAQAAGSALDLGCGTGELAAALAQSCAVTGVDPAAAMLDIARQRPGGDKATWVQADARALRLDERFDLVLLTGHAFQVFLTDDDQCAALATIAAHLTPNGRFIFDSRNPAIGVRENSDRDGTHRQLDHSQLGEIEAWNESTYDEHTHILTYENGYRHRESGETFAASAQIRYTSQAELAQRIAAAGLVVDQWLGDWLGNAYDRDATEIIPIGHLA
jgi:ubiquinone/menaquinone biosynthesis C-methylase UbiE